MSLHPSVRNSFFIKFLLATVILGNLYVMLQSLAHTFNFHAMDLYLRWYGFKAPSWMNLFLLAGTILTFWGALNITKKGISNYKFYFFGKVITCTALLILIIMEYRTVSLPFPFILVPVLVAVESLYPIVLYISLRKSKIRR